MLGPDTTDDAVQKTINMEQRNKLFKNMSNGYTNGSFISDEKSPSRQSSGRFMHHDSSATSLSVPGAKPQNQDLIETSFIQQFEEGDNNDTLQSGDTINVKDLDDRKVRKPAIM